MRIDTLARGSYFVLTDDDAAAITVWESDHPCTMVAGALGEKLTYTFVPTSLGMGFRVTCVCGHTLDLSHLENW